MTADSASDALKIFGLAGSAIYRSRKKSKRTYQFRLEGKQLDDYVDALNYLYPGNGWELRRARKDHSDLFGDQIEDRELYFQQQIGQGWHEVVRLSRRSMDRFLYALHGHRNWLLEKTIHHLRQEAVEQNKVNRQRQCPPLPF